MKHVYLISHILFFISFFFEVQAQSIIDIDTLLKQNHHLDTVITTFDTIVSKSGKVEDSITQILNNPLDSLLQTIDGKQDSVAGKINEKILDIEQKITKENKVAKQAGKIDEKLQSKIKAIENTSAGKLVTDQADNLLPVEQINKVKTLSKQAGSFEAPTTNKISTIKPIEPIKATIDGTSSIKTKASAYGNKLRVIPQNKISQLKQLPAFIESKAFQTKGLKAIETHSQQMEDWKQQFSTQQDQLKQYQEQSYLKEQAQVKLVEKAKNHFAAHADKLQEAQETVAKFKKKYTGEEAAEGKLIRQRSLQGKPLGERLVWGGQFQVLPGTTFSIDLSPMLGYQLNKLWIIAMGGTYRVELQPGKNYKPIKGDTYGVRSFTEHKVYKGFFMHGEYELMHTLQTNSLQDIPKSNWVKGILIGIGNAYHIIGKVKGRATLLYNLTHQSIGAYQSPWIVRFGFTIE